MGTAKSIPSSEMRVRPGSFRDGEGQLFFWDGGLYRRLSPEYASSVEGLFREQIVRNLVAKGLLVETELTNLRVETGGLVLKHRQIPFVSYPFEWCGPMLRDAALLVLDLETELARHGFTVVDPHPWNVLFEGCRPVFIDFSSIVPADPAETGWRAFRPYFQPCYLQSLRLYEAGHGRIARAFLQNYHHRLTAQEVDMLLRVSPLKRNALNARAWVLRKSKGLARRLRLGPTTGRWDGNGTGPELSPATSARLRILRNVRREVERLKLPSSSPDNSKSPVTRPSPSRDVVQKVIAELQPGTVLDALGAGWVARLAGEIGIPAVALYRSESQAAEHYLRGRETGRPALPLIADIRYPAPAYGYCYDEFARATTRLRCDMVVATGLTGGMIDDDHDFGIEQMFRSLAMFTRRWLLVEILLTGSTSELEMIRQQLCEQFASVKVLDERLTDSVFLLCAGPNDHASQ